MLIYFTIFGLGLLVLSLFIRGVIIHLACLGVWIAVIINAGASLPDGSDRTWLQITAALLMIYSVIMIVKKFLPSGVD